MKRLAKRTTFALFALMLANGQLNAQFTTTFAKNATPGQQNGFYYSLPQTMLQLDFTIKETKFEKGPLSDYADNYFETSGIGYESDSYELLGVQMSSRACPDPNATFFIALNHGRGSSKAQFDVMPNGIIRSVSIGDKTFPEQNITTETFENETFTGTISPKNSNFICLNSAGKTNAQLAKEVADKVAEIRKEKFFLITSDGATASNPETFNAMYQKLEEMEEEYLSLILGKRVTRTIVKTVFVIPSKETPTQTVAKFSEIDGLTSGTSGNGSPITVQVLPLNGTGSINAPSQSAIESMSYDNKLFYRVPETANVKISLKNTTLLEERQVINQLGVMLMAPLQNVDLIFDTTTGQIINLRAQ